MNKLAIVGMKQKISQGDRPHIVLYGEVNSGKSSLFNLLLGQEASVVSDIAGTTTDAVSKAVELPGIGAVVLVDTPGVGDETLLGQRRMEATERALRHADVILCLVPHGSKVDTRLEQEYPRAKVISIQSSRDNEEYNAPQRRAKVISMLAEVLSESKAEEHTITGSLVKAGNLVLLVMPQDSAAPKGRLILPQVQTIRELLDKQCQVLCLQPSEFLPALNKLSVLPDLVIIDSQVFKQVEEMVPDGVPLTSFSVLMSAYKGSLPELLAGAKALNNLAPDARILIAEACSHAPTSEDIGRVKLPMMLRKKYGEGLVIDHVNGNDFPSDLTKYDLVIHCGACMFNRQHLLNRQDMAVAQSVPMTNYGIAIAAIQGILSRIALPQ